LKSDAIPFQIRILKKCGVCEVLLKQLKIMTSSRGLAACFITYQSNASKHIQKHSTLVKQNYVKPTMQLDIAMHV